MVPLWSLPGHFLIRYRALYIYHSPDCQNECNFVLFEHPAWFNICLKERLLKKWKDTKYILAISTGPIGESEFKNLLGSSLDKVESHRLQDQAVMDRYYNKIQFQSNEAAKEFYTFRTVDPIKGISVVPDTNTLQHNVHISEAEAREKIASGELIKGTLRIAKAGLLSKFDV